MFRTLSITKVSLSLLRCGFYYANLLGVVNFNVRRNRQGHLTAFNSYWLKSYCLICRLIAILCFCYAYTRYILSFEDFYSRVFYIIRFSGLILCNLCILLMQIVHGQQICELTNRFLKIFERIRLLTNKSQRICYGHVLELVSMLMKIAFLAYEVFGVFYLVQKEKHMTPMCLWSNAFLVTSACMLLHISFIGYLSVGVLYNEINKYVQFDLRSRLHLARKQPQAYRRVLRNVNRCLNESVDIYEEIQLAANQFQRLFDLSTFLALVYFGLLIVTRSYEITRLRFEQFLKSTIVTKSLLDVILICLAIQAAVNGSQRVQQMSLENYNVIECRTWDKKMEMFLSRLKLYELHVRPLGLFEMSNEFILFILSSLLTYLTYLIAL